MTRETEVRTLAGLLCSHTAVPGRCFATELPARCLWSGSTRSASAARECIPRGCPCFADAVNHGCTPPVPLYGATGTRDDTVLASTALCPRRTVLATGHAAPPLFPLCSADTLANYEQQPRDVRGAALGESALACRDLASLLGSMALIAVNARGPGSRVARLAEAACASRAVRVALPVIP